MNEENALKTTGVGPCAPATGWPDAKREAEQLTALAAPPLAGERSVPANVLLTRGVGGGKTQPKE